MPFDDAIRVSDAERDSVVAALSDHHAAGRLNLSELQERVEAAYRSVTRADVHRVLADLPAPRSAPTPALAIDSWSCASWGGAWASWLVTGVICLTVWVLTSIGSGEAEYFWPMWVIGPWGLVMAAGETRGRSRQNSRMSAQKLTDEREGERSGDASGARR